MKGLIFCKKTKPYLLSKNFENHILFSNSTNYELGEKLILSHDDQFKYVAKNCYVIGDADFITSPIDLNKMSLEGKLDLYRASGKKITEVKKMLKNKSIGQALYFNRIRLFKNPLETNEYVEHKRDKFLKTIVEREVFAPTTEKKVFYKGEIDEENPMIMLVLTSQEIYDLVERNISTIIRKKTKNIR